MVVVGGGDGTVSEVAKLLHAPIPLGVVPLAPIIISPSLNLPTDMAEVRLCWRTVKSRALMVVRLTMNTTLKRQVWE